MKKYYPKLDKKTGQFLKTPKGKKTPKMLEMEKKLGIKFENDYKDKYLSNKLGQKLFAKRWQASKGLIFANNLRGGRRSWIEMLGLKKKNINSNDKQNMIYSETTCEICEIFFTSLDHAHWIESKNQGSSKADNILKLCPNCHRLLDRDDKKIVELAREKILFRNVNKMLSSKISKETPKELLDLCRKIILTRS